MSLDFNLKDIKNYKELCWNPIPMSDPQFNPAKSADENMRINVVTNSLVWAAFSIGLNQINEKNINEWFYRLECVQMLGYTFMTNHEGKNIPFTYDDLVKHIGLKTNVSHETRPKFMKTFASNVEKNLKKKGLHFKTEGE